MLELHLQKIISLHLLESIPDLQECESRLAELLLFTRLGFSVIPDDSVSRALESFNAVIEDLEVAYALMRGQGGHY